MNEQLRQLVAETCSHPPGSLKRQQGLTKIIRLIQRSKKLWQENQPYYEDALQQTWLYFCQNVCEGVTGEKYDPDRSSVNTWLNRYLRWRLQDFRANEVEKVKKTVSNVSRFDQKTDPIENIAASPDIPPIFEKVKNWVKTDREGKLRSLHIQGRPDITCQVLILRRLPPETSWKKLSAELGIAISTLSSFYQRQCLPCLRKFAKSEGYIE